jgi:hypothetical protein
MVIDRLIRIGLQLIGGAALLQSQAEQGVTSGTRPLHRGKETDIVTEVIQFDRADSGVPRRAGRSLRAPALQPQVDLGEGPLPLSPERAAFPSKDVTTNGRLVGRRGRIDRILVLVARLEARRPAAAAGSGEPIMGLGTQ